MRPIFEFWTLLSPRERFKAAILCIFMLISAGLEVLGIGLIMPVIAIFSKPEIIEQNKYLAMAKKMINPSSDKNFILILCFSIIALFIIKNAFLSFQTYLQAKFVYGKGAELASKLFENYMHAHYRFHLDNNSGNLIGKLNLSSSAICQNILMPGMIILTELAVVSTVLIMLFTLSASLTFSLMSVTALVIAVLYFPLQNYNRYSGQKQYELELELNKLALQGLKAVKDSKILNVEDFFSNEYKAHQFQRRTIFSKLEFIRNVPRFFIETFVVSLGMGSLIVLILSGKNMSSIFMLLSLFTVSLIRLLPSMSRIQYNVTAIKQFEASFKSISNDLSAIEWEDKTPKTDTLYFKSKIEIKNISFSYSANSPLIFDKFLLEIPYKSSVAFVGPTGCGKTTLVDIILGLLKPNSGEILVDGVNIEMNLPAWQKKIGYVPQFIFLLDDSIRANVAFGQAASKIDDARVKECLKTAQILDFVESLPQGINSLIGENGIRLSGGQRQRIGIARALYHNPEVLVLDEATSALDNDTEKAFIDALKTLHGKLTIVIVAHRMTTVQNCDRIIKIE